MKPLKVSMIVALILAPVSQVLAEPYAKWGLWIDGTPLDEMTPGIRIPEKSAVPIPPPPGGVLVSISGDKNCTMTLRTHQSPDTICGFYRVNLSSIEYHDVDFQGVHFDHECAIFRNGDMKTSDGVMVYVDDDRFISGNGRTGLYISYVSDGQDCGY